VTRPRVTDCGTCAAYKRGCRCPECRAYQNGRVARNRAALLARLQADPAHPGHGRRSSYDAGCRCGRCRDVRAGRYQALEARDASRCSCGYVPGSPGCRVSCREAA
jgi:hypothetical protein